MPDQLDMIDWLRTHEETKPDYLWQARSIARRLLKDRDWITVDDIRAICPPPADMHPTVMGAIFKHADFEHTGEYVASGRDRCHRRPVGKFRLTNYARVHEALGLVR
jgi:hypothetical protein